VIHIYFGDGKGKTSAAIGLAVRAAGAGRKVAILFFDKGGDHPEQSGGEPQEVYSERRILRSLPNIAIYSFGLQRFFPGQPFRHGMTEEDLKEARRGYDLASKITGGKSYSVIILDEILGLVGAGALREEELLFLMELSRRPPEKELVLTGRVDSRSLIEEADLVTEMRKVKHYFDSGKAARKGIEY
jgi:cob(I)alamin adenosyltransferase